MSGIELDEALATRAVNNLRQGLKQGTGWKSPSDGTTNLKGNPKAKKYMQQLKSGVVGFQGAAQSDIDRVAKIAGVMQDADNHVKHDLITGFHFTNMGSGK